MNFTISGHHFDVPPELRDHVAAKLERITRHFDQVVDVKVLFSVDNHKEKEKRHHAECTVHVKGCDLHAESAQFDSYAAVDDLMDKLDRQVVRYKERLHDHQSEARRAANIGASPETAALDADTETEAVA